MTNYSQQEIQSLFGRWLSELQPTIEAAQTIHDQERKLFDAACVLDTGDGYTMANLRTPKQWPPIDALADIEEITGFKVVSICEPLLGIWQDYEAANSEGE